MPFKGPTEPLLKVGDKVDKVTGDYTFTGWVVGVVKKRNQTIRYVVENSDGLLHIFKREQLELMERK